MKTSFAHRLGSLLLVGLLIISVSALAQNTVNDPSNAKGAVIKRGGGPTTGTAIVTTGPTKARRAQEAAVKKAKAQKEKSREQEIKYADTLSANDLLGQPTTQQLQIRAIAGRINQRANEMMKTPEEIRYIRVNFYWADASHTGMSAAWSHAVASATTEQPILTQHLNALALVLPDSVTYQDKRYPVVALEKCAFKGCNELEAIALPLGLHKIGEEAFSSCKSLKTLALPETLTEVSDGMFSECAKLTDFVLPQTVQSIGVGAFENCAGMEQMMLSDSLITIGNKAFYHCDNLMSVLIPTKVSKIGIAAFGNCQHLAKIDVNANNASYLSLDGVLMSEDMTTLCQYPAGKDKKSYAVQGAVVSILPGAFEGVGKLQSIGMPANISAVPDSAFMNCVALAGIDIPEGVNIIGAKAFYHCLSLKKVTLPSTLKIIDCNAFDSCVVLTALEFSEQLTQLGAGAFRDCHTMTSAVLPQALRQIGCDAFRNCNNLRSVALPDSLQVIETATFYGCSGINTISLPSNLLTIKDSAYYGCSYAGFLLPNDRLREIGKAAFAGCSSLESIDISSKVERLGEGAFYGCTSLEELHLHTLLPVVQSFDKTDGIAVYVPKSMKKEAQKSGNYKMFKKLKGESEEKVEDKTTE
jgi:hypothetical protein